MEHKTDSEKTPCLNQIYRIAHRWHWNHQPEPSTFSDFANSVMQVRPLRKKNCR